MTDAIKSDVSSCNHRYDTWHEKGKILRRVWGFSNPHTSLMPSHWSNNQSDGDLWTAVSYQANVPSDIKHKFFSLALWSSVQRHGCLIRFATFATGWLNRILGFWPHATLTAEFEPLKTLKVSRIWESLYCLLIFSLLCSEQTWPLTQVPARVKKKKAHRDNDVHACAYLSVWSYVRMCV